MPESLHDYMVTQLDSLPMRSEALTIIEGFVAASHRRRSVEEASGYPFEYGGDGTHLHDGIRLLQNLARGGPARRVAK